MAGTGDTAAVEASADADGTATVGVGADAGGAAGVGGPAGTVESGGTEAADTREKLPPHGGLMRAGGRRPGKLIRAGEA
ncbi:hypothetical protein GCM10022224_062380 [Nonomuraea antimicrobica]|uniref:Uncharacterized protein n=1 Tax=Nonomuraea antimicrobica TaxID=561173 RepID=A0ABP7CIW1_9ACTN